jgi:hypothetical protein
LWAVARYDLRISEEEFWRLTLKHYDALVRRFNEERKERQRYMANILAKLHNVHRGPKDKAVRPEDFLNEKRSQEEIDQNLLWTFRMLKQQN